MAHEKSRRRGGFSLTELLIALLIFSLISAASAVIISAALRISASSARSSEADLLADTINVTLRDILTDSSVEKPGGDPVFVSQKYSGFKMSLRCAGGRLEAVFFVTDSPQDGETAPLFSEASYGGFEVAEFSLEYSDGFFNASYTLADPETGFSRQYTLSVAGECPFRTHY